jgi:hypothetical protein
VAASGRDEVEQAASKVAAAAEPAAPRSWRRDRRWGGTTGTPYLQRCPDTGVVRLDYSAYEESFVEGNSLVVAEIRPVP